MNQSPFEDLIKKDFFASLRMWLAMELISFAFFPALGLVNVGNKLQNWFLISLPLGLGGAFLVAASSQFIYVSSHRRNHPTDKGLMILFGQLGGWIGAAGIMFPLIVVITQFFTEITKQIDKVPVK